MNWKRTLWILWAANFFVTAGMSLVIPFLPLYIEKLGVHSLENIERWSGLVFSAQFITSVIFQPIWGRFADKHGRKIMLLRAGLGMGIVTALMGAVGSVWQLLFLRLFNGIFSGFISMSVSLQASITPDEQSGQALGMLQTGAIAGNLIGPLIGGVMAEKFGFRQVFFLTGGLLVLASVIVMIFVHEHHKPRESVKSSKLKELRRLKPLFPIFLASTFTQVGMMSIEPIVSIYAKTLYTGAHLASIAGLVVAISGIANLIGAPTLGRLSDRIGQRKVLILSLSAAACMYIPQALAGSIGTLLIGRFLLGLFIGGMIPSLNVLVKKKAPEELQATAFGFNSSSTFLGNLVGPLIGSTVAASYGIKNVFYVTMGVLLMNAVIIFFNRKLEVHS
ncbi:arabinose efflux permease family protein [Desulfosporosinus orientis DSM 765]|uniref:Arabinose efflux permease family protein n=1 Tax=Desulfosporosinus orientis (strain ATCC 19365 / DSM 765 / NCIMB 8382 / VKM B-1628 / Singapore I) TaxID=768706 RepID=G7WFE6_DESOD|nr:MFS transporter [Desulfosporosinus orientis]AET68389.1 arabinose efflux permease family protein [Desulfosporosinus orientis DSM 765]